MNALENLIRIRIEQDGPMSVSEFMALALSHPQHGYYMKQDPFGQNGDFTTAPEINQMFGEMIGVWLAHIWIKSGSPAEIVLVECGPGRGSLMSDILRSTQGVPGFHDAVSVHLIEISPVLKEMQQKTLADYDVQWHETLDGVPQDKPLFIIGNEFFDALPVQHLIYQDGVWRERRVGFEGDSFCFVSVNASSQLKSYIPQNLTPPSESDCVEVSVVSRSVMDVMCGLVSQQGGALLFIDYGYEIPAYGETLQALRKHKPVPVLRDIGNADLTVHVNFGALQEIAKDHNLNSYLTQQGAFLKRLGIDLRAQKLIQNASQVQQNDIESALHRLVNPDDMGSLFKVFCAVHQDIQPEGFA